MTEDGDVCLVRKGSSAGSVGMTLRRPTRHSGSRMPQDAVQRNNIDIDSNSAATNDAQQPVFHQDQWMEALQHQASTLSVGYLQQIGHQIVSRFRADGDSSVNNKMSEGSSPFSTLRERRTTAIAEDVEAAALFTATCSIRPAKDQVALIGTQDKVLAELRALLPSPSLPQRYVRAALLSLVAQPGFCKKKGGYRQHLVQALVEAAYGPVPLSALIPTLQAMETGPSASDLIVEVVEKVATGGGGHNDEGSVNVGDAPKKAIIELLHHVVTQVVTSSATGRMSGKGTSTKSSAVHLTSFLMQACSALPYYMLLFSKDLLRLSDSRSCAARKLCLSALAVALEHGGDCCREPSLASLLHFARSDGDATIRCAAFSYAAEYLARRDLSFNHEDWFADNDESTDQVHDQEHRNGECANLEEAEQERAQTAQDVQSGGKEESHNPGVEPAVPRNADALSAAGRDNPWAQGGILLVALSVAASALLTDDSKAVRSKALACCTRILERHGDSLGEDGHALSNLGSMESVIPVLLTVEQGAWAALENLAGTNSAGRGTANTTSKAADAARELLCLIPYNDTGGSSRRVVDLLLCYMRCQPSRAGATSTLEMMEAKRALRALATEKFCCGIAALLGAISSVMAIGMGEKGTMSGTYSGNDGTNGENAYQEEGEGSVSLMGAFCELLMGVDVNLTTSLLQDALDLFASAETTSQGDRESTIALLHAIVLLGEATSSGDHSAAREYLTDKENNDKTSRGAGNTKPSICSVAGDQALRSLASHNRLFWRALEKCMGQLAGAEESSDACVNHEDGEEGGGRLKKSNALIASLQPAVLKDLDEDADIATSITIASRTISTGKEGILNRKSFMLDVQTELAGLLDVFRLLAGRSLLSTQSETALEALVFPAVLSKRRLIRPAVGLALVLEEPRRVLLSSLAVLQDAGFARSSTDVARACDYVHLIGVLARENASFIAAHVGRQYEAFRSTTNWGQRRNAHEDGEQPQKDTVRVDQNPEGRGDGNGDDGDNNDDYMAGVSSRESMEREIRRLQEASVTSDGILSCYTPFLLAIVQQRLADATERSRMLSQPAIPERSGLPKDGNDGTFPRNPTTDAIGSGSIRQELDQQIHGDDRTSLRLLETSCPPSLAMEALWALSEYAVLSPFLATTQVLPLVEALAMNTQENLLVRYAAACIFTRRELATDAIAARACALLEDPDPLLRTKVLVRLGRLMQESRIKTAHLSRFALLLVDEDERVRMAAEVLFFEHVQPRPDSVSRCVFETYFTLDTEEDVKQRVLKSLIAVSSKAVPGQSLASLGGALVRKATETDDVGAAFFLSLVPPTSKSLEATEVCLRRGHISHMSQEAVSLLGDHFAKGFCVGGRQSIGGGGGEGSRRAVGESSTLLPKAKALEMSARIEAMLEENKRRSRDAHPTSSNSNRRKLAVGPAVAAHGSRGAAAAVIGGGRVDSTSRTRNQQRGKQEQNVVDDIVETEESADNSEEVVFQKDTRRSIRRRQKKRMGEAEKVGALTREKQTRSAAGRRTTSKEARGQQKRRQQNMILRCSGGESSDAGGENEIKIGDQVEQQEEGDREHIEKKDEDKPGEGANNRRTNDEADDGQNEGSNVTSIEMARETVVTGRSGSAFTAGATANNGRLPWRPGRGGKLSALPTLGLALAGEGRNDLQSLRNAHKADEKGYDNRRAHRAAGRGNKIGGRNVRGSRSEESVRKTRHSDGRGGSRGGFGGEREHSEDNNACEAGGDDLGMVVDEDADTEMELCKEEESEDEWKDDRDERTTLEPQQNRSKRRCTRQTRKSVQVEEDSNGVAADDVDHDMEVITATPTAVGARTRSRTKKGDQEDGHALISSKRGNMHIRRLQRRNRGAEGGCSSDNEDESDADAEMFDKG